MSRWPTKWELWGDHWQDPRWEDGFPKELLPGMILEHFDGSFVLVGHVNPDNGGKCGCCWEYDYGQGPKLVRRWAIIVEFGDEGTT